MHGEVFAALPAGAWDKPPEKALVVPMRQQVNDAPAGLLVVGLNPFRHSVLQARVEETHAVIGRKPLPEVMGEERQLALVFSELAFKRFEIPAGSHRAADRDLGRRARR